MKIVFMGTMDFAVPILAALDAQYEIVLVVTQPDRPIGRKQELNVSAVKTYALLRELPLFQPDKIRTEYHPIIDANPDLIVVAAYGQMIPKLVLNYPKYHCINVHASLLPKYRGGSPMHRAITEGETETGVTVMYMAQKMDAGMILAQASLPILLQDNVGTLEMKLASLGSQLLLETLPRVFDGSLVGISQDEAKVTFAPNIKHEEEFIDFSRTGKEIFDHVRGFNPWPIASSTLDGVIVKFYEVESVMGPIEAYRDNRFGEIVVITKNDVFVKVSDGLLAIKKLQLAGKKPMDIKTMMNGSGKNLFTIGKIFK
jgi:methionyl-tRNA formyltransferase